MNTISKLSLALSFACLTGLGITHQALAQSSPGAVAQVPSAELTLGEIRKVDKDSGKVTIKHETIKNLDMPPMTMSFTVRDKAMLDKTQVGDKIRFRAINEMGKTIVTQLEKAN